MNALCRPLESIPMSWIDSESVRYFLRTPEWIPIALKRIVTELRVSQLNWTLHDRKSWWKSWAICWRILMKQFYLWVIDSARTELILPISESIRKGCHWCRIMNWTMPIRDLNWTYLKSLKENFELKWTESVILRENQNWSESQNQGICKGLALWHLLFSVHI